MYGYTYKISTTKSNKVYIGLTTKTVEKRFAQHLKNSTEKSKNYLPLYQAMNLYGKETFSVIQIDTAKDRNELNRKERYWIKYYDSINNGYNVLSGGTDENPMNSSIVKEKHDNKMRSKEVREKISKTLSETLKQNGRSEAYRKKISDSQKDRQCFKKGTKITYTAGANIDKINQLTADGWINITKEKKISKNYKKCIQFATRSRAVYCILNTGERFEFDSILHAGKWWYETYKPFGESYSTATYQRKIKASIAGKDIIYNSGHDSRSRGKKNNIIKITNIKWFYVKEKEVMPIYE